VSLIVLLLINRPGQAAMPPNDASAYYYAAEGGDGRSPESMMAANQSNRAVADVEEAFDDLTERGEWLGFRHAEGVPLIEPDPIFAQNSDQHIQGIVRSPALGGPPVFYVTRSGDVNDPNNLGGLMVATFGSGNPYGERLGSNRLRLDHETQTTIAPPEDSVTEWIPYPDYEHPGGIQMVGTILAVPLETPLDGNDPDGKIIFYDTSDPLQPEQLPYEMIFPSHNAGVVGITRLVDGHFFLLVTWGFNETVEFYRSNSTSFFDPGFAFEFHSALDYGELAALGEYWVFGVDKLVNTFQSLQFVNQADGKLFLIGTLNNNAGAPFSNGDDLMWLWEVQGFGEGENATLVGKEKEVHKWLSSEGEPTPPLVFSRQEANLQAAAGAYVSPNGELLYYSASYYFYPHNTNPDVDHQLRMAELRNIHVSQSETCGPQIRFNHLGGPYTIPEGASLNLNGYVEYIYPWVHMFEDEDYGGASVMMDFLYRNFDDYDNFNLLDGPDTVLNDGFNDKMTSYRWCGPVGATLFISQDEEHVGSFVIQNGDGWVSEDDNVDGYNDEASSVDIIFTSPSIASTWDLDMDGQFDDGAGPLATYQAGAGSYNQIVYMHYKADSYNVILQAMIFVENVPPVLDPIGAQSGFEGTPLQFTAKAMDPGGFVAFSLADGAGGNVPDGAVIDEATGVFSWTPTAQGYYTFDVCASDGEASDCETIVVKVYGDVPVTGFKADGYSTVNVSYEINAGPAGGFPFAIQFYRSTDPVFDAGDSLLSSVAIDSPADLADGNHALALTLGVDVELVSDADESDNDYYLLAVAETGFVLPDGDNTAVFSGAYQYPGATNVFVHGTEAADTVFAGSNNLALNGDGYFYGEAIGLRVRVHKGDDVVSSNFTGPVALLGGPGNDLLSGGNWPDYIDGGEGDNTLRGRGGSDVLLGGPGNDLLIGGNGNDALKGGAGNDTAAFPGLTAVNANLSTGIATGLGTDTVADVENLTGSDSRVGDVLIGNNGPNILDGGNGPDVLDGRLGLDTLLGGGGNDKLTAGGGCGGDGKVDVVDGGAGFDTAVEVINDVDTLIDVESKLC
jgi:hypothetical protein